MADYSIEVAVPTVGPQGEVGPVGPPNELAIGTVTGGASASATITGTPPNQTLNLVLPQGEAGPQGPQGPAGEQTTDASLLTSGTLNDARLSANVVTFSSADARYGQTLFATRTTSLNLTDTNYVVGLSFASVQTGTYYLQGLLPVYGGNNSSGVRRRIVGNTATITGRRGYYFNYSNAFVGVANIAAEQLLAGTASTPASPIFGSIVVTVAGRIDVEFAQNVFDASPSILQAEAHLLLTKIA